MAMHVIMPGNDKVSSLIDRWIVDYYTHFIWKRFDESGSVNYKWIGDFLQDMKRRPSLTFVTEHAMHAESSVSNISFSDTSLPKGHSKDATITNKINEQHSDKLAFRCILLIDFIYKLSNGAHIYTEMTEDSQMQPNEDNCKLTILEEAVSVFNHIVASFMLFGLDKAPSYEINELRMSIQQQAVLVCCRAGLFDLASQVMDRLFGNTQTSLALRLREVVNGREKKGANLELVPYNGLIEECQEFLRNIFQVMPEPFLFVLAENVKRKQAEQGTSSSEYRSSLSKSDTENKTVALVERWITDYLGRSVWKQFSEERIVSCYWIAELITDRSSIIDTLLSDVEKKLHLRNRLLVEFMCTVSAGQYHTQLITVMPLEAALAVLGTICSNVENLLYATELDLTLRRQLVLSCCREGEFDQAQRLFDRYWLHYEDTYDKQKIAEVVAIRNEKHEYLIANPYSVFIEQCNKFLSDVYQRMTVPFLVPAAIYVCENIMDASASEQITSSKRRSLCSTKIHVPKVALITRPENVAVVQASTGTAGSRQRQASSGRGAITAGSSPRVETTTKNPQPGRPREINKATKPSRKRISKSTSDFDADGGLDSDELADFDASPVTKRRQSGDKRHQSNDNKRRHGTSKAQVKHRMSESASSSHGDDIMTSDTDDLAKRSSDLLKMWQTLQAPSATSSKHTSKSSIDVSGDKYAKLKTPVKNEHTPSRKRRVSKKGGSPAQCEFITSPIVKPEGDHAPILRADTRYKPIHKVTATKTLCLAVSYSGQPEPELEWQFNSEPIEMLKRVNVRNRHDVCLLSIQRVSARHSGIYCLTATNNLGSASVEFNVFVKAQREGVALKDLSCTKCDRVYHTIERMKQHMRTHNADYVPVLFKCSKCDRTFTYKYNMEVHMRRVHLGVRPPKRHGCRVCGEMFHKPSNLLQHERSQHKQKRETGK